MDGVVPQHGSANQEILTRISLSVSLFSHSSYILAQPHPLVKRRFCGNEQKKKWLNCPCVDSIIKEKPLRR